MSVIEDYIVNQSIEIQPILNEMYEIIKEVIPDEVIEKINYGMPAFYLQGNLVYFAAQKKHLGFYPTRSGIENFEDYFKDYKYSKGAVQFSYDKPLPKKLIQEIVKFRVSEQLNK